jgi:hypothetical protein
MCGFVRPGKLARKIVSGEKEPPEVTKQNELSMATFQIVGVLSWYEMRGNGYFDAREIAREQNLNIHAIVETALLFGYERTGNWMFHKAAN